jgi:hypothetical protein
LEQFQARQLAQYQEYLAFHETTIKIDPSTPERVHNSFGRYDPMPPFQKPTNHSSSGSEPTKEMSRLQRIANLHFEQQVNALAHHATTSGVLGSMFGIGRYPGQAFQKGTEISGPAHSNLFVFHIPNDMSTRELWTMFSTFGEIISCRIMVDARTQMSRGFGFVSFDNPESATKAISSLDGFPIGSKHLRVSHKKETPLLWTSSLLTVEPKVRIPTKAPAESLLPSSTT